MTNILIAILCGFVGGLLGAIVIAESRESDKTKEIESLIKGHLAIRDDLTKEKERIGLVDHAVRVLAEQNKRERGAILGNLNDVWNHIDRLYSQDIAQEAETDQIETKAEEQEEIPDKPKKRKKTAKTEESKDDGTESR
jgi:hypothetical protein